MNGNNRLKHRLQQGQLAIGTWSVLPSADVAEVLAGAGLDFIIIDMEHGPAGFETAQAMCQAIEGQASTPLIRVANLDASRILRALETGVHGVVIPGINGVEEARAAVKAVKYAPEGERGFSPFTRSNAYTPTGHQDTFQVQNSETMLVLIVEGKQGIEAFEDIANVPGVDVIYIGTYDLSLALGVPGQTQHPVVQAALRTCVQKGSKAGLALGCLVESQAEIEAARALGIRFLAYSADCAILANAAQSLVDRVRRSDL